MAPTILFVPGWWEGPAVFQRVASLLSGDGGFQTETAVLPSTGTTSPGNPTMYDDIAAIRAHLSELVARGDSVLLVLHSASGFLGSQAMQGLDAKGRGAKGEKGGVVGIVFLAAGIVPEGGEHHVPPFAVVENGTAVCPQPETFLFADLPEAERQEWVAALKHEPSEGWDGEITYGGWKDVPSVYLICDGDALLPVFLQEQYAGFAGSKVVRCSAGHIPQVSQPEKVVEVIREAIVDFAS